VSPLSPVPVRRRTVLMVTHNPRDARKDIVETVQYE
jgi:ABC-type thiamine transport system ATPase subunit